MKLDFCEFVNDDKLLFVFFIFFYWKFLNREKKGYIWEKLEFFMKLIK